MSVGFFGSAKDLTASTFNLSTEIPSFDIVFPKYFTFLTAALDFDGLRHTFPL